MLAKKTSKNQLTLPKEIIKSFPDIEYFDVSVKDRKIILMPVRITPADSTLEDIRTKVTEPGIKERDVADAVASARKDKKKVLEAVFKKYNVKLPKNYTFDREAIHAR